MKTNPAARSLVKLRFILLATALVAMVGLAGYQGATLASRLRQIPQGQTDGPAAPKMDLGDLMAAAR